MQAGHKRRKRYWASCGIANRVYEKVVIKGRDDYKLEDLNE